MRLFATPLAVVVLGCSVLVGTTLAVPALAAPTSDAPTWRELVPDADHAVSSDRAMQMAQVYGHEVLDESQTTATSQVWARADGSWRMESFAQPVRVKQRDRWVPVDDTLTENAGVIVPVATTLAMRFSAGGSGPMASLQASNGQWVSITSPFGALPAPTLNGDTATYADVVPDVDLTVAANTTGFSEVLVVKTPTAAASTQLSSLRFGVSDGALTSTPLPGGGLVTSSQDGTVQVHEGQPTWWDSSMKGADADGPADAGVARPLVGASSTPTSIDLDVSTVETAADPVYPVFVDPSWNGGSRYSWTYVDNAYPDQSYYNGANLGNDQSAHVGFIDSSRAYDDHRNHVTRAYFTMWSYGISGKHVLNAQLNTKLLYSSSCTATNVSLRTADRAIGSTTSWNNQPSLFIVQDTKTAAYRPECHNGGNDSYLALGFNATQIASDSAAGHQDQIVVALQADEGNWTSWKKFDNNPSFAVTYNTIPGQPAGRSVKPCFSACSSPVVTSDRRPALTAAAGDADGGNLSYDFEVWRGWAASPTSKATGGRPASRPQNTLVTWKPGVDLPDGQYEYRVRATDGTDFGPWSNGWIQFTVDTTAPAPPDATITGATTDPNVDQADVQGTVGAPIGLSFATSRDSSLNEIAYSLFGNIPSYTTAPACNTVTDTVVVVCRTNGSFPSTLKIAALDTSSTLTLVGFDAAGNVSSSQGSVDLFVNDASYTSATAAHSWRIDPATTGSIPDAAVSNAQPLVEGSGVGRSNDTPNSAYSGFDDDTAEQLDPAVPVSTFSGQGAAKTAGAALLDMGKSFTFTAWAKPTDTDADNLTGTKAFAVFAQEGPKVSGAFLDAYRNNWRFCMPTTQRSDSVFDGVCALVSGVTVNQWVFLIAQWDAVNKQVRLTVGVGGTTAVKSHPITAQAAGVLDVGVRNQPGQLYPFVGSLFYPTAAQVVASSAQLYNLSFYKPMSQA